VESSSGRNPKWVRMSLRRCPSVRRSADDGVDDPGAVDTCIRLPYLSRLHDLTGVGIGCLADRRGEGNPTGLRGSIRPT